MMTANGSDNGSDHPNFSDFAEEDIFEGDKKRDRFFGIPEF